MSKVRNIVLVSLICLVVISSGIVYYHSYVEEHSSSLVGVSVNTNVTNNNILVFHINAIINSTNKFTKFDFNEHTYVEGLHLFYAGKNESVAPKLINKSIIPSQQICGFIHFNISNRHPDAVINWNNTVYNFNNSSYMHAPNGYYIITASMVGSNGVGPVLNIPEVIVQVENNDIKIIPLGES